MNKCVIVTLDSFEEQDLEVFFSLPYTSAYVSQSALVKKIRPIYPTLTYPIHATIATGRYPDSHGITHNQMPGITRELPDWNIMGSDWYWERRYLQGDTIMDVAHDAGLRVASILWPVTAGEKRFFNVPEIWPVGATDAETVRNMMQRMISLDAFEAYYDRFMSHYDWRENKDLSIYGVEIAFDLMEKGETDVLFLHDVLLDHIRHVAGNNGVLPSLTMRFLDTHVGQIVKAAGGPDATNFIFLGDHGQIDVHWLFHPNICFADAGMITLDDAGNPTAQRAYAFSSGFSCYVYVEASADIPTVHELLKDMAKRYPEAIERVYTAEEAAAEEHLSGDFAFVLEGQRGVQFEDGFTGEIFQTTMRPDYRGYRGNHGHHPDKEPLPALFAFGPDIIPGATIDHADMVDICPTIAALLGIDMPGLPGKVLPIIKQASKT